VLNDLDRFDLVLDVISRLKLTDEKARALKQLMEMKLIEHREYINIHGVDMPEVRDWKWNLATSGD